MSEETGPREILDERGHGECLEAISWISDTPTRCVALAEYIEEHRRLGVRTKQTRRAARLLKAAKAEKPPTKKQTKSAKKIHREQARNTKKDSHCL